MEHATEFITIAIYLVFLMGIGIYVSRLNQNIDDYVRGGAKGSWWMVGMSGLMASLSAFTFTGNAGGIFQAGFSTIIVYMASIVAGLIMVMFLAAWFRQTRAITLQDILRRRFGPEIEQINGYTAVILWPLSSAVMLWSLAIFCSALFNLPLIPTLIVIGAVVVFYSTTGGRWAVMATDFFQSLVMLPIVILVAFLCLARVGGIDGFIEHLSDPKLAEDFSFVNADDHWPNGRFSPKWMGMIFLSMVVSQLSFVYAGKFLSVKDGREARKAALLTVVVSILCLGLWFVPPMTARFLLEDQVMTLSMDNPESASYALMAREVLPNGLIGILIVAMFAATMSSMDTGLNAVTGTVVHNLLPPLFKVFRKKPMEERNQLAWCKSITLLLGAIIILYALVLATQDEIELFDVFFVISSVIGLPMGLPLFAGLFIKKLPRWSFFSIAGFALIPSLWSLLDNQLYGTIWTVQDRILWIFVFAAAGTLISLPFYKRSSLEYRQRIEAFFSDMRRPVDYEKEVGGDHDVAQLKLMGNVTLIGCAFMALLLLLPNAMGGRLAVLFLCSFLLIIGLILRHAAKAKMNKTTKKR